MEPVEINAGSWYLRRCGPTPGSITYGWAEPNVASERIARSLGFVPEGRLRSAWPADGVRSDVLVAGPPADDPQA